MKDDIVKQKILYYATARFLNEGLNITMESIAADLGISKKTLYKYFPNKSALADEMVNRFLDSVYMLFQNSFKNNADRLIAMSEAFSKFANLYASKLSKKFFEDLRKNEPEIWKKIDNFRTKNFKSFFPPVIKEGIAKGYFRKELNPDIVLLMYLSSIQGVLNPDVLSQSSFSAKEAAVHIIKTLFYGISTPKGKIKFDKYFKKVEAIYAK